VTGLLANKELEGMCKEVTVVYSEVHISTSAGRTEKKRKCHSQDGRSAGRALNSGLAQHEADVQLTRP